LTWVAILGLVIALLLALFALVVVVIAFREYRGGE
jgi:hypothetical protein